MSFPEPRPGNDVVFMDIRIGAEMVGRLVIELRTDTVPKTAKNFRSLCLGDHTSVVTGSRLHYKNTAFHMVKRMFMAQGGDVVRNNGTSGESIYGPTFEDENFTLKHEEGAVSMANYGSPHTNNSQFFITVVPCSHLDGTNVVVGYVLRGMGILKEMEKFTTDSFKPMVEIVVEECGVLSAHDNWHYYDPDDQLPPFPADWVEMNDKIKSYMCVENLLKQMRDHANLYYSKKEYVSALRHYKKMKRYYHVLKELPLCDHSLFQLTLSDLNLTSNANMAACQLKLGQYKDVVKLCTAVLIKEPDNVKALYRKGVAEVHLMNYDEGLQNLKEAHSKEPHDPLILKEFQNGKELMLAYRQFEKASIRKMFPELTATPVTPPPHCPTTATSPADTETPSSSAVSPTSSSTQHSPSFSTD